MRRAGSTEMRFHCVQLLTEQPLQTQLKPTTLDAGSPPACWRMSLLS